MSKQKISISKVKVILDYLATTKNRPTDKKGNLDLKAFQETPEDKKSNIRFKRIRCRQEMALE